MRYGRLSQKDHRDLTRLLGDAYDDASDLSIWWHERAQASRLVRDKPMADYYQQRADAARDRLATISTWLRTLDAQTKIMAPDFVKYQEGAPAGDRVKVIEPDRVAA